ncbi:MAG TPA: response regulator transcription factor [Acidimicrobiales bacterium]|jgi:two-component system KDP operon response regulator KdpE|nr:response regulator transcription factor [Acidimicrobiales bacterium]
MARILLVDDDQALLRALRIGLSARGYDVVVAHSGEEGVTQVSLAGPDVVVLDLGLPDIDGIEVCRRVRQWSAVPIIVLSAAGTEDRKVAALDAGADDYVTKPFGMAELEARLRAALRRSARSTGDDAPTEITVGRIDVDLVHHMARLDGQPLDLTAREFDLLAYLARHAGKVCTHQMILRDVWGSSYGSEAHYLRVYAHRLRRKLGDAGHLLRTQPGIGYQLLEE